MIEEKSPYLTRKEAAQMFRCNESTIHRWNKEGMFKKYQIGGRVLYKREELKKLIVPLD